MLLLKKLKKNPVILYKHCDGYPENVGVLLKRVIENTAFNCESEHIDKIYNTPTSIANTLLKGGDYAKYKAHISINDFKLVNDIDDWCHYLYIVDCDLKSINVYYNCNHEIRDKIDNNELEYTYGNLDKIIQLCKKVEIPNK